MRLTRYQFDRDGYLKTTLTQVVGIHDSALRARVEARIRTLQNPDATPEELAAAADIMCSSCGKQKFPVVEYDDDEYYPRFCADCLRAALALLESKP